MFRASARSAPRVFTSHVLDIAFHFSVEEYFLTKGKPTSPIMFLWRPQSVITIGRHQNPWKECVMSSLENDDVLLMRRESGGGAVFQDPGCSVFSFISPSKLFSIDKNFEIILGSLHRLGIPAVREGRNDITVAGRKISGSAFRHAPDSMSLHHGTVLVNTDLQALGRYLTPNKQKLSAKGIKSVKSRVMNLVDEYPQLDHDSWSRAIVSEFKAAYDVDQVPILNIGLDSQIGRDSSVRAHYSKIMDPQWRFGRTPEFTHQLETRIDGVGVFDVQMKVVAGKIEDISIFSDALFPQVIQQAMDSLKGVEYGRRGMRAALNSLQLQFNEGGSALLCASFSE